MNTYLCTSSSTSVLLFTGIADHGKVQKYLESGPECISGKLSRPLIPSRADEAIRRLVFFQNILGTSLCGINRRSRTKHDRRSAKSAISR